ncbi:MAG: hypothetical protein FWG05_02810, partial [Kiritimatiellaeota bacterium]|nr:hypothetical protein [Kiritimatiellota bacterium]
MSVKSIFTFLFACVFTGAVFAQSEEAAAILNTLPRVAPSANATIQQSAIGNQQSSDDASIAFTFEQVDVRVFTQVIGNYTGKKFVVADDVRGQITVVSPNIPRSAAHDLFVSVLESSGFTIVGEGEINRVIRLPERKAPPGTIIADGDQIPDHGLVTHIILLRYTTAREMCRMLENHLQRKEAVNALDETNHIIITDTADAVKRIKELISHLDKPGMERITEVIPLQHADSTQLARQLNLAHADSFTREGELLRTIPAAPNAAQAASATRPPLIVAAEHANRLIVTGTQRQITQIKTLIAQMDVPAPTGRSALNVILLSYAKAETVAQNISALLDKTAAQTGGGGVNSMKRAISVEAVTVNNALLVDAAPEDFAAVKRMVEALDTVPRQVLVTVRIVEVSDGDLDTFGVTMTALNAPDKVGNVSVSGATRGGSPDASDGGLLTSLSQGIFGQGLTIGVAHGSYLDAAGNVIPNYPGIFNIDAIRKNSKVNILSDTSLGVQDNHSAEIAIVDNIGILESTITGT